MKRLQSIRIPNGWTVSYNNWYECDPEDDFSDDFLVEDLYQIFNEKYDILVDIGWYGSVEEGSFCLILLQHDFHGEELAKFTSRKRLEILEALECWLENPMKREEAK